jgi:hypothetical protein
MVYLARKGDQVVAHADRQAMMDLDGVVPEMEITDEEFEAAGGRARIIDGEIFLGKTAAEKATEALRDELDAIDTQLAELDRIYLTPRILAGIGQQDEYAIGKAEKHETMAIPLRERREEIKKELEGDE